MPKIGDTGTTKSGKRVRWDGYGWEVIDSTPAVGAPPESKPSLFDRAKSFVQPALDAGRDAFAGATRGVGDIVGNMAEDPSLAMTTNPLTAPVALAARAMLGKPKTQLGDDVAASARTSMPGMVDQFTGADPNSMAYATGEMGARVAPYVVAATAAPNLGIASSATSGTRAFGSALGNVATRSLLRGAEGGAVDAAIGGLIGDNPAAAGVTGGVSGAAFSGLGALLGSGGGKLARIYGNVRGAVQDAADTIGASTMPSNPTSASEMQVGLRALSELRDTYKELAKVTMDGADTLGSEMMKKLTNIAKADRPGDFLKADITNQSALRSSVQGFANSFSDVAGKNIDEEIVNLIEATKQAHLEAYGRTIDDIATTMGVDPEQFAMLPISEGGARAFADRIKPLLDSTGDYKVYGPAVASIMDVAEKVASGTATIGQFRKMSTELFDPALQPHIPSEGLRKGLRGAINDAMAGTIRDHGGDDLAKAWLENREQLAKRLSERENKALQLVVDRSKNLSAPSVVNLVLARPEWADAILQYTRSTGGEQGVKNLLAKGMLQKALDDAMPDMGSGAMSFGGSQFASTLSRFREAMPSVMSEEHVKVVNNFADLAQALSSQTAPYAQHAGKVPMANVTEYGGSAAQQAGELGVAQAMQNVNPVSAAVGLANNGLTWFARKNAIERIALNKEALGFVLSDEALSRQLTERMAVTLSGLRKGTIAGADDKLAAAIKGRIARTDRELFKKIWGKRSAANSIVEAPGKSGGMYGAGSAVMTPNEQ